MEVKSVILRKDLPNLKKGAVLVREDGVFSIEKDDFGKHFFLDQATVLSKPDWFYCCHDDKTYEVLSWVCMGTILEKSAFGRRWAIDNKNLPINSVKRLTDGVVFSIGDYMEDFDTPIVSIKYKDAAKDLWLSTDKEKDYGSCLEGAIKKKKKEERPEYELLQELPNVHKGTIIKLSKRGTSYVCKDKNGFEATFTRKLIENNPEWFKDISFVKLSDVVQDYLFFDKPILTLNDLLSVWGNKCDVKSQFKSAPLFQKFKQLAIAKLINKK